MSLRSFVVSKLLKRSPRVYAALLRLTERPDEPECALAPYLCDRDKLALDVGSNIGLYTRAMVGHAGAVHAFDPNQPLADLIARRFPKAKSYNVALSDRCGTSILRFPEGSFSVATIERANPLPTNGRKLVEMTVQVRTLDSYAFHNVGFVKIDVEGHEEAVLRGAAETIRLSSPHLLIEIEERHNRGGVARVREWLGAFGYSGYFLNDKELTPINQFDPHIHQRWGGKAPYVNNFLFLHSSRTGAFRAKLAGTQFRFA
ncbi:MAG: FkbM family methyltransferase [Alphaproteobacteria bacterium]